MRSNKRMRKFLLWNIMGTVILSLAGLILYFLIELRTDRIINSRQTMYAYFSVAGDLMNAIYAKNKNNIPEIRKYYNDLIDKKNSVIYINTQVRSLPVDTKIIVMDTISQDIIKFMVLQEDQKVSRFTSGFLHVSTIHYHTSSLSD